MFSIHLRFNFTIKFHQLLYGATWLRQDCARSAIAHDSFQKSFAQVYNITLRYYVIYYRLI